MNGKKAKRLRRAAEQDTIGAPSVRYLQNKKSSQTILHPDCTRRVYKDYKQGKRHVS